MKVGILITALRNTDMYIEDIFTQGGCYKFHLFLKKFFPTAEPFISIAKNHIVTKINGKLYDIKGRVKKEHEKIYTPLVDPVDIKRAKKWSFRNNNLLMIKECPFCEEPICV